MCMCVCTRERAWGKQDQNGFWKFAPFDVYAFHWSQKFIQLTILICVHLAEYDWEASHFSKVAANVSHDQTLPLHHDDIIIKAVPVRQHNEQEQVLMHNAYACTCVILV